MSSLFSVKDKVIVITGGTGVLGKAISKHLAREGGKIVILGRSEEKGAIIVNEIDENGGEAMFLRTDVLDSSILEQNLTDILKKHGRVDVLLNAAGGNMPGAVIPPEGSIFDLNTENFQQVVDLNLTGTILPTKVFLKPMIEQKSGCIVNFASASSFRPLTRVIGYSAAKAGIVNLTQFMATEVAHKYGDGIRVNAIAPGFFIAEQNRSLLTNEDGSLTQRGKDIIKQTPFGRFGEPDELCGTIQYLISDASKFVTGTVAIVDGGFNAFAI